MPVVRRLKISFPESPESTALERWIEWLLVALLAFCPLVFGAVQAWSEMVVVAVVGIIALLFAILLVLRSDLGIARLWVYAPVAAFLALCLLQLIPLPVGLASALAPGLAALKADVLADLPPSATESATRVLNLYPESGWHDMSLLLSVSAVFVVTINLCRSLEFVRRVLGAIAIIGGVFALLALAQDLTGTTRAYWIYQIAGRGRQGSGSFVNYSHFCQFMNLTIGAAAACLIMRLHQLRKSGVDTSQGIVAAALSPEMRRAWVMVVIIVACMIAIPASLSRGGVLAMVTSAVVTSLMVCWRFGRGGLGWVLIPLLSAVLCIAILLSFDRLAGRFAVPVDDSDLRLQMLRDLPECWKQFPLLGTGLGSFAVIFPMFDRSNSTALARHADNEYAQVLTETGVVGLALVATFLIALTTAYARCLSGRRTESGAAALGTGFGLLAILIQSSTDFGQHIPACALITAVFCAILLRLPMLRQREVDRPVADATFQANRFVRVCGAIVVAAVFSGLVWQRSLVWRAEREWARAARIEGTLQAAGWQGDNTIYADLLTSASRAVDLRPGNIEYGFWLNVYRWNAIARWRDPATGMVRLDRRNEGFARRIVRALHEIRPACPTFGPVVSFAGQLEKFQLGMRAGDEHILLGYRLSPNDPTCVFVAGQLAATRGDWTGAADCMRKYGLLTGKWNEVIGFFVNEHRRADLALDVVDVDVWALGHLRRQLIAEGGSPELVELATERYLARLQSAAAAPQAGADVLRSLSELLIAMGRYSDAVAPQTKLARLDASNLSTRLRLALVLEQAGMLDEAIVEAEAALRRDPDNPQAIQMTEYLYRRQLQNNRQ